jgi:opacity protein-like surface antigen
MKIPRLAFLAAATILFEQSHVLFGQSQEIALSIGAISPHRFTPEAKTSQTLQANYGYALTHGSRLRLLAEFNVNTAPLIEVKGKDPQTARDVAALFLIPGLRLRFAGERRISPYVAAGIGYAQFHGSELLQSGAANPLRDRQNTYAANFAGGADLRVFRWLAFRGEVRQFVGPGPDLGPNRKGGTQGSTTFTGGVRAAAGPLIRYFLEARPGQFLSPDSMNLAWSASQSFWTSWL